MGLVDVISLEVFTHPIPLNRKMPMIKNILQIRGDCHLLHLRKSCLHDNVSETVYLHSEMSKLNCIPYIMSVGLYL